MYVLSFGNLCCYMQESPSRFPCFHLALLTKQQTRSLRVANYIHAEAWQYTKHAKDLSTVAQTSNGRTNFFSILSHQFLSHTCPHGGKLGAKMADSAHIYSYRGTTPRKSSYVIRGPCPAKVRLCPTHPIFGGPNLYPPFLNFGPGELPIPTPYLSTRRHAKRHLLQDGGLHTYIFLG